MIELVVVVAITVVLCALLVPVFTAARDTSDRMTCARKLRDLGVPMLNFVAAYQGLQPAAVKSKDVIGHPGGRDYMAWYDYIWEFVGEGQSIGQVPRPSDTAAGHENMTRSYRCPMTPYEDSWRSYAITGASQGARNASTALFELILAAQLRSRTQGNRLIENAHPSDTAWLADARPGSTYFSSQAGTGAFTFSEIQFRHKGRANILYYDGRVESIAPPASTGELTSFQWRRFTGDH